MRIQKPLLLVLIFFISLWIWACGGGSQSGGSSTNTDEKSTQENDELGETSLSLVQVSEGNEGEVTVPQTTTHEISQTTHRFTMPAPIAPTGRWVQRANGLCGNTCRNGPRHMYSAAFQDKLLVSWMAKSEQDAWTQFGNVATFTVGSDGSFVFDHNVSFEGICEATYGLTTNEDGSVIAVLCRGLTGQTNLVEGAIDLLETRRNEDNEGCPASENGGDWEGQCYPIGNYSEVDSALYLMEYTSGKVAGSPDSIVHINHAVGGWNYGHHEISLNAAGDTYFINIKVTAGPSETNRHEGLTHFAVQRPSGANSDFSYLAVTDGWGCGPGHVLGNRTAYNNNHDTWAKLCSLDTCSTNDQFPSGGACKQLSFGTIPGVTKTPVVSYEVTQNILDIEQENGKQWVHFGGLGRILSLGEDGWLGLATGADTIGVLSIPLTVSDLQAQLIDYTAPVYSDGLESGTQTLKRADWKWFKIPDPVDTTRPGRPGMANMAYFDTKGENSSQFLVGWSPTMATQGIASEYVVSTMTREGELSGTPYLLSNAGWGEDNNWVTMPNSGCVVFPFSWIGDKPGADYPHAHEASQASDYSNSMYLTSLCNRE